MLRKRDSADGFKFSWIDTIWHCDGGVFQMARRQAELPGDVLLMHSV
jgi:hypothetical protein